MALIVRDSDGNFQTLSPSAVAVGIGTTEVARALEVAGVIVSRENSDGIGVAAVISSDEGANGKPQGVLSTNASYDPNQPFKGFKRMMPPSSRPVQLAA